MYRKRSPLYTVEHHHHHHHHQFICNQRCPNAYTNAIAIIPNGSLGMERTMFRLHCTENDMYRMYRSVENPHPTPLCVVTVIVCCYIVVINFTAHLVGRIVSRVRVSASFQIILLLLGALGSVIRVSVSFQSFALKMFVCPVIFLPSCLPFRVSERSIFCPACTVMMDSLRVFYGSLNEHYLMSRN